MSASEREMIYGLKYKNHSLILRLDKNVFTIGNSSDSNLELKDDTILKRHAVLEKKFFSTEWYVKGFCDLQDSGVFVNNNRIMKNTSYLLNVNDILSFGNHEFVFCIYSNEQLREPDLEVMDDIPSTSSSCNPEIVSASTSQNNLHEEQVKTLTNILFDAETNLAILRCKVDQLENENYALIKNEMEIRRARDTEVTQLKLQLANYHSSNPNRNDQVDTSTRESLFDIETEVAILRSKVELLEDEKIESIKKQKEIGRDTDVEVSRLKSELANHKLALLESKRENERLDAEMVYLRSKRRNDETDISQLEGKLQEAENILTKIKNK